MENSIFWTIALDLRDGGAEAVRVIAPVWSERTMAEPDALAYEWWIDDADQTLHIYERYASCDAALQHLDNVTEHLPELKAVGDVASFTIYGDASEALRSALAHMSPKYMTVIGGFVR